jgi:hypothetical protein
MPRADWLGAPTPTEVPAIASAGDAAADDGPIRPATITETLAAIQADVVEPSEAERSARPAAPTAEAFDELAFLRSVIDPTAAPPATPRAPGLSEPQKTLRCTECGTMNLPTEWYCERCGGELASF